MQGKLEHFLDFDAVPPEIKGHVAARLRCQCGGHLELSSIVGLMTAGVALYEEQWRIWTEEWEPRLTDFSSWLEKHPYLGLQHEVGKRIGDEIRKFPVRYGLEASAWFRARQVVGPELMSAREMGPPSGAPRSEGRFSHHGQAVLYLATDAGTAAAEVLHGRNGLAWIQEFRMEGAPMAVDLNLGAEDPEWLANLPLMALGVNWSRTHLRKAADSEWRPQYLVPRFISDCVRAAGLDGIVYRSTRHNGECLVLFQWSGIKLVPVDKPHVLQWEG